MALFSCTTHVVDIGGLGQSPDGRQVYHEGLFLPLLPLMREGKIDESVMRIIRANVREPVQVEGDIHALIGCNLIGERRLSDMMREHGIANLDELGRHIIDKSRAGMVAAIGKLPRGTWKGHMRIDGYDAPIDLHAAVTIHADHIAVDYAGTSASSIYGINSPMCYTEAYTAFGIKCVVAPTIPNNAGTLDSILVTAPENTIVNALHPAAVNARSTIGHMLPDVCYDALHQALPGRRAGRGHQQSLEPEARRRPRHDRHDRQQPALHGDDLPFRRRRRAARPRRPVGDALPVGRAQRAGRDHRDDRAGRRVEEGIPSRLRRRRRASRRTGPGDGSRASRRRAVRHLRHLRAGQASRRAAATAASPAATAACRSPPARCCKAKGFQTIPAGERLVVEMPGGGGFGDPKKRDRAAVKRDVKLGLVSEEQAKAVYGVDGD